MCYIWAEGNDSAYSFVAANVWEFDLCNWGSVRACCCSLFCVEVCREELLSVWEWIDIALNYMKNMIWNMGLWEDLPLWQTPVYSTFARTSFRPGVGTG